MSRNPFQVFIDPSGDLSTVPERARRARIDPDDVENIGRQSELDSRRMQVRPALVRSPFENLVEYDDMLYPKYEGTPFISAFFQHYEDRRSKDKEVKKLLDEKDYNNLRSLFNDVFLFEHINEKEFKIYKEAVEESKLTKDEKDRLISQLTRSLERYYELFEGNRTPEEIEFLKEGLKFPDKPIPRKKENKPSRRARTTSEKENEIEEEDLPDLRGGNNNFLSFLNNSHRFYGTPH